MVYFYRENMKHFTGPHMVSSSHGKGIVLYIGERTGPLLLKKTQLRPVPITNAIDDEPSYKIQ